MGRGPGDARSSVTPFPRPQGPRARRLAGACQRARWRSGCGRASSRDHRPRSHPRTPWPSETTSRDRQCAFSGHVPHAVRGRHPPRVVASPHRSGPLADEADGAPGQHQPCSTHRVRGSCRRTARRTPRDGRGRRLRARTAARSKSPAPHDGQRDRDAAHRLCHEGRVRDPVLRPDTEPQIRARPAAGLAPYSCREISRRNWKCLDGGSAEG